MPIYHSCSTTVRGYRGIYIGNKTALDLVSYTKGTFKLSEAVGRREVAEREVADCVTATLALPVVWRSLTFAVLEGAAPPTEGVESVLENEVLRGLFDVTGRRETGKDGYWIEVDVPVGHGHTLVPCLHQTTRAETQLARGKKKI